MKETIALYCRLKFKSRGTQRNIILGCKRRIIIRAKTCPIPSTFLLSHLLIPCCDLHLFGRFPILLLTNETLDIEGIKESDVPRPIVIPTPSVIRTLDLLPLRVEIDLVTLGEEPSGVEEIESEDVQIHKSCFEDL
jgi:hypothetical protein